MDEQTTVATKRPKLVWAISIFYVISALWTILSFYLVLKGSLPLTPEQKAYFRNFNILDYGL
jgi:hypothetical protein